MLRIPEPNENDGIHLKIHPTIFPASLVDSIILKINTIKGHMLPIKK